MTSPDTRDIVRIMDRKVPDVFDVFGIGKVSFFNDIMERIDKVHFQGVHTSPTLLRVGLLCQAWWPGGRTLSMPGQTDWTGNLNLY